MDLGWFEPSSSAGRSDGVMGISAVGFAIGVGTRVAASWALATDFGVASSDAGFADVVSFLTVWSAEGTMSLAVARGRVAGGMVMSSSTPDKRMRDAESLDAALTKSSVEPLPVLKKASISSSCEATAVTCPFS